LNKKKPKQIRKNQMVKAVVAAIKSLFLMEAAEDVEGLAIHLARKRG